MPPPNDIEQQLTQLTTEVNELKGSVWLLLRLTETILSEIAPNDLSIPRLQQEQRKLNDPWKQKNDCND